MVNGTPLLLLLLKNSEELIDQCVLFDKHMAYLLWFIIDY